MKEQKKTAEQGRDETLTITGVSALAPDQVESSLVENRQVESRIEPLHVANEETGSSQSLVRLEQDLEMLRMKWRAVEEDIDGRNKAYAKVKDELDDLKRANEALLAEKEKLEQEIETGNARKDDSGELAKEFQSKNAELRLRVQELEDYIDGRKAEWDRLNAQLRDYEDAIDGMNARLANQADIAAGKDEEKAAVATRLLEVEQELAELTGRHREREESHAELQQSLEDQSRELGSLNGEVIQLKQTIKDLEAELGKRDEKIGALTDEIEDHNSNIAELEALLEAGKQASAEQQMQHDVRVSELELALNNSEAAKAELEKAMASKTDDRGDLEAQASEHEIRAAELNAMYLEAENERKSLEAETDAQRELIVQLEKELGQRQGASDAADTSAEDRLAVIGAGLKELDVRIDSAWMERPDIDFPGLDDVAEAADEHDVAEISEVLLTPEELFTNPEDLAEHVIISENDDGGDPERYPLLGSEITIGRAHNNDIRINSKYISRHHARILIEGDDVVIEDAGSCNGFSINNKPVRRATLEHGDELELGLSHFRYERLGTA